MPAYDGNTSYEGLNVRLQKQLSSGLTFIAAYTWSKQVEWPDIAQAAEFSSDPLHTGISHTLSGRYSIVGRQSY